MADESVVDEHAVDASPPRPALGRITRVVLKNYMSIVSCDVGLQPLTILVGPNGSGKSNFLDALAFVSEALTVGLDQAILRRNGLDRILSAARTSGEDSFSIELHFQLSNGEPGRYGFDIVRTSDGGPRVRRENLALLRPHAEDVPYWKLSRDIHLTQWTSGTIPDLTRMPIDRLFLVTLAGLAEPRPAFDLLTSMVFYDPLPGLMRDLKRGDTFPHLRTDGSNLASMLRRMQDADPEMIWGITQYMKRVLPGLEAITTVDLAGRDLLQVSVASDDPAKPYVFDADQLSDGTLRALAVLVALFQHRLGGKSATSLVGIEEPENNIHPAAARILLSAFEDASYNGQVFVTTHSADMLHMGDADPDSILAVSAEDGVTSIGPIDKVSRSVVRDQLYTVGELLQMDQLRPEPSSGASNGGGVAPEHIVGRS